MRNNIWTIMSKEFTRFFTDRRMVIMTIMPAILIYVVYSFMGSVMGGLFAPDEGHTPRVYAVNMPDVIAQEVQSVDVIVLPVDMGEAEAIKDKLGEKDETVDALIIFQSGFADLVQAYDVQDAIPAPNIEIYYNSTVPNSNQTFRTLTSILDAYEASLSNKFDINRDVERPDLATSEDMSASIISSMMPMLLMIFLYTGSMSLALESITGEKERGTLATLLVSPLKRSELAIGKILSLAVLSFLSGIITTFATIMAMPNLMGGADFVDAGIYGITDYVLLALVILSALLLIIALLSIVSAFAKTVKEAGQAATPLMFIVMFVGLSGMFGGSPSEAIYYLIPMYGSVQSMNGIFSLDYSTMNIAIACLSSLIYAGIGGFVLAKMFNSEKVMFSR